MSQGGMSKKLKRRAIAAKIGIKKSLVKKEMAIKFNLME
jgi:hypothetical protein